ncbi:uncharacterized protein [Haliotis asinina]|uniref:uncharacterized protein isoform X2 n=1 Tax=Haliotis asinina TaxID=109174 RepID=UPI003532013A
MAEAHRSGVQRFKKSASQHKKRTYDIIITAEFWNTLGGADSDLDTSVLRIEWRGVDDGHRLPSAATTRWTVHTTGNTIDILMQIGSAAFTRLHHFVDDLENDYGAELLHIRSGLTFVFRHRQVTSENKMVADKGRVMQRFQSLLHGLGAKTFHVSFDGQGETGQEGNSDSAMSASDDQLELAELEKRLEERMLCQTKNMENFINNVILQSQTHIGNELGEIRSLIHTKRDATLGSETSKGEHHSSVAQTDQDNNLTCGGKSPLKQCNELEEVDSHTQKTSTSSLAVRAEVPQSFQHHESRSEIIRKNLHQAREVLNSLTINLHGWRELTESTALALEPASPQSPTSTSASTVLCLDVSGSVGEHGFEELKEIAHRFIDGIESVSERYGLKENIGVVRVGGEAAVTQDLTNDYRAVRDAIDNLVPGGPSPLFAGLVVSVASIKGRTGILSMGGVHNIKPRIIFITDGYATSDTQREGPDTIIPDSSMKSQLTRLTTVMAREKADTNPVTWVPVGTADKNFLSSLAQLGKQELVEGKDIRRLCSWYRLQDTTGKLLMCCANNPAADPQDLTRNLDTAAEAFIGDMAYEEKASVIQAVKDKLEGKTGALPDDDPSGFDNVFERDGLPPLGSRVQRGPDWSGGNEDVEGPGTIINHCNHPELVWVKWDLNCDSNIQYSYGHAGQYGVLLIDSPRRLLSEELIEIGVKVQRGIDWSYGNQDGGYGSHGIIIRTRADGRVKVRWDNGHINSYNFGCHGRFDLEVSSLEEDVSVAKETRDDNPTQSKENEENHPALQTKDKPLIVWQWKDEGGNWRLYSKKQIEKLNKEYTRKSARSCVLQKGSQSIRVLFKVPMLEKSSTDSNRHEVQRVAVSSEDLDQLIQQTISVEDVGWTWE